MKISLALSGGGARGFAHIGCIKAIQDFGLEITEISGASSGAIVGAFICNDYSALETKKIIKQNNFLKLAKPALSYGLLTMKGIEETLLKFLPHNNFSKLKLPLSVCATDLLKGKSVYFNSGEIALPLMASASVPLFFKPIKFENKILADGGILNNLPIEPLKKNKIVGIHVNPIPVKASLNSSFAVIERSVFLSTYGNVLPKINKCDYFIEPSLLSNYTMFDFKKVDELFTIGYDYTLTYLKKNIG